MFIEVNRDIVTGQLMHGWSHGLYWRGIRAVLMPYGINVQALTYIQVLVPDATFDIRLYRLRDAGGLPPLHHKSADHGLSLGRVTGHYGGFPAAYRMQWLETYYGTQYLCPDTGRVIEATSLQAWYPCKFKNVDAGMGVSVTAYEFMKHLKPAARHICNCIMQAGLPAVSEHPAPETVLSSSVP